MGRLIYFLLGLVFQNFQRFWDQLHVFIWHPHINHKLQYNEFNIHSNAPQWSFWGAADVVWKVQKARSEKVQAPGRETEKDDVSYHTRVREGVESFQAEFAGSQQF